MVCNAPAEVLMASAETKALPFEGTRIASTPIHAAVRAIPPKLRTSVILSKTKIHGSFPSASH